MKQSELRTYLEVAYARYHRAEFLSLDPLQMAHRYERAEDREVAALIAAAFASGNIKAILAALEGVMGAMGSRPAKWLRDQSPKDLRGAFSGVRHRWVMEQDIEVLMALLGETLRRHGTLGRLWREVDDAKEEDACAALGRFVDAIVAMPIGELSRRNREVRRADGRVTTLAPIDSILLTSPARGSACKRMNLFLRWVARPDDGVDLGLWTEFLSPARLTMPVDTHVLRISRRLRLTKRKLADMRAAQEITARLRKISPEDPCRYDFSFVRMGVEEKMGMGNGEF
ncbi:TIGR02757 family protein [soil metagenome]